MCVKASSSTTRMWLVCRTTASTDDGSFPLSDSKCSRKPMRRLRTCTGICGQSRQLHWSLSRRLVLHEGGAAKKSSGHLEEPRADSARTESPGSPGSPGSPEHQVPKPRADGGHELFLPEALTRHGFASWKHLQEIRCRSRNSGPNSNSLTSSL